MSLIGALNVSSSALAVQQAAIQVTSNNVANAGNADYTRQQATITPNQDQQIQPGLFVGTGTNLTAIQRQIDEALQTRLNGAVADNSSASTSQDWLSRVEATFNELSDQDLSTQMSTFFNSWSALANKPQDVGLRQVVIQDGQSLADSIQKLRGQLGSLQNDVDTSMKAVTANVTQLGDQIAGLNAQIVKAEGGNSGQANSLRDQRDALIKQLSSLADVKTVDLGNGMVNVMVGSEPLVNGTTNRGLTVKTDTVNGKLTTEIVFKDNNGTAKVSSGQLGALADLRDNKIGKTIDQTDSLAQNLIFELNKIHSSGQGLDGVSQVSSTNTVNNSNVALNDAATGLANTPTTGSFVVHVTHKGSGLANSTLVHVDLDGLNGNDTTLESLRAQLSAIPDVTATISAGKLQIKTASSDEEISFSQDSSGTLAALGVNSFFTGKNALDIAVNSNLVAKPTLLAAAKNGEPGDNQTALAIAGLESQTLKGLNGSSLKDSYQAMVNGVSVEAASAKTAATAAQSVQDTFEAQREAVSGVSLDEEAMNLMRQQRAYQASARVITTIDDLMKTLLAMT